MENIDYRDASFNVIKTLSCERTRIYDAGNNYLHTHWDFTVETHWHPALNSYDIIAPGTVPFGSPGKSPGVTDVALLNYVLQPRGPLTVTAGETVILEAPGFINGAAEPRFPCDVKGGPSVELVAAPIQIGIKHWVVQLRFVADVRDVAPGVNPADATKAANNAVISNLWVGSEDIDFQRRSVRRFAGRAILRADVMRLNNVNANSFRDLYLFPCPDHYQRQVAEVSLSEDGTVLDWAFTDTMRGYDLGVGSPIVRIECFRSSSIRKGSPLRGLLQTVRPWISNTIQATTNGISDPSKLLSIIFAGIKDIGIAAFDAQIDNLPKYNLFCRCDLVGDRNANLGFLTAVAYGVCANQMQALGINSALTGLNEIKFTQDIADQVYTSVEWLTSLSDEVLVLTGLALDRGIMETILNNDASVAALGSGSVALMNQYMSQDQTELISGVGNLGAAPITPPAQNNPGFPPTPAAIAAAATGVVANRGVAAFMQGNPPLNQGAYPAVPANGNPFVFQLGKVPSPTPTGSIPAGIQHLIVQAIIGPNVTPPRPGSLTTDS